MNPPNRIIDSSKNMIGVLIPLQSLQIKKKSFVFSYTLVLAIRNNFTKKLNIHLKKIGNRQVITSLPIKKVEDTQYIEGLRENVSGGDTLGGKSAIKSIYALHACTLWQELMGAPNSKIITPVCSMPGKIIN